MNATLTTYYAASGFGKVLFANWVVYPLIHG